MFKPLALYVGLRYTRAKRRNHFISFISLTSMMGIALGVTALITVLSVMNGFEKELRTRMLGLAPHVVISSFDQRVTLWRELIAHVKKDPEVIGAAPYIQGQGMVTRNNSIKGTLLQGVDPEREKEISQIQDKLQKGQFSDLTAGSFGVFIGKELAQSLQVTVGDKITVVVPQVAVTPVGVLPRMKRMTVKGVFQIGMHEFDSALVVMHIADAAKLLRMPEDTVHGVNIKIQDMFAAQKYSYALNKQLPAGYHSHDWSYRHANFFQAIKMEKRVMFIILTLIVAVAAFNIVSTLVMMVTDKQADIAILQTLGASPRMIMQIFMVQGAVIGTIGTLLGVGGGLGLALNVETIVPAIEKLFNTEFLPAEVYYISDVPSDLHWSDVTVITAVSLFFSFFATLYPAWRASRTQPAEALRYE